MTMGEFNLKITLYLSKETEIDMHLYKNDCQVAFHSQLIEYSLIKFVNNTTR